MNKFVPEKLRVAKCCNFLTLKLCCSCEKSNRGLCGRRELDPKNPDCINCLDEVYRQVYGEERK